MRTSTDGLLSVARVISDPCGRSRSTLPPPPSTRQYEEQRPSTSTFTQLPCPDAVSVESEHQEKRGISNLDILGLSTVAHYTSTLPKVRHPLHILIPNLHPTTDPHPTFVLTWRPENNTPRKNLQQIFLHYILNDDQLIHPTIHIQYYNLLQKPYSHLWFYTTRVPSCSKIRQSSTLKQQILPLPTIPYSIHQTLLCLCYSIPPTPYQPKPSPPHSLHPTLPSCTQ